MKSLLIITEDVVKIQTFTGYLGRTYSRFFLYCFRRKLILKVWWLKHFYQVSVLTSDGFNLNQAAVYYYSRELSKLNYADKRLSYWQETKRILDKIKALDSAFFTENGLDITQVFATRLCTNLAYDFMVYPQIYQRLVERLRPDKVIYYHPGSRFNHWLFGWLLRREYRQKLIRFLSQSRDNPTMKKYKDSVLLSLDFFRHKKTLEPIFLALQKTQFTPVYVTDSFLADFLPEAEELAREYLKQGQRILRQFSHQLKPMIVYSLVLSKLYLRAAKNLFAQLKPRRVVVVSDLRYLENSLNLTARKNRIKSLMVSPNTLLDLAEINPYDSTDQVALPGQFIKDKLIKQRVAPKKLIVVGDLQTTNVPRLSKKQVYEILGIKDISKKLILLISFRPNWLIPLSEKQKFIAWSVAAVEKIPDAALVIKPHPTEKRYRVLEELKAMELREVIVADNQRLELVDLLNVAAVVVQTWSMTLFEAVILKRPVICVNPWKKNYSFFLPAIKSGGGVEVTSQKQLAYWLDVFLHDHRLVKRQLVQAQKAIAYFVKPPDGHEVQRVLKLLL